MDSGGQRWTAVSSPQSVMLVTWLVASLRTALSNCLFLLSSSGQCRGKCIRFEQFQVGHLQHFQASSSKQFQPVRTVRTQELIPGHRIDGNSIRFDRMRSSSNHNSSPSATINETHTHTVHRESGAFRILLLLFRANGKFFVEMSAHGQRQDLRPQQ